jgi:hypothetical protein
MAHKKDRHMNANEQFRLEQALQYSELVGAILKGLGASGSESGGLSRIREADVGQDPGRRTEQSGVEAGAASRTEERVGWRPAASPPDDSETILVATAEGEVGEGYKEGNEWVWSNCIAIRDTVTHWRHLPPHPDESEMRSSERVRDDRAHAPRRER